MGLRTSLSTNWIVKDVRYIMDIKLKLISIGQLDEKGSDVTFGNR